MNLSKNNTKERIVEAAVELFSRQGYSGTGTRQVARLADINETSLFRYFPHKQDLFWAALETRIQQVRVRRELWNALKQPDSDPKMVLPLLVDFLVHLTTHHDLIRLFLVGFIEMRPATERIYQRESRLIVEAIREYLAHAVERGALQDVDPVITAVAFAAGIVTHELPWLFGDTSHANAEEAVSAHSRYWLSLLAPSDAVLAYSGLAPAKEKHNGYFPLSLKIHE